MPIGDIKSVSETTYGFRTKLLYFIDRIELLRRELKREKSDLRILDVGCSNGVQMAFPLGAKGYTVLGIDMHEPSIEYAKRENIFKNVEFLQADINNIKNAPCGRVDVIILSDILEHISDPAKLLLDIHSLLAPRGIILISIPNGFGPFEIENFILRKTGALSLGRRLFKKPNNLPYNHESGHVQFFSLSSFQKLLSESGFAISDLKKGCFLGGSASNFLISRIPWLIRANIRVGRLLPYFLCSVWYLECKKHV